MVKRCPEILHHIPLLWNFSSVNSLNCQVHASASATVRKLVDYLRNPSWCLPNTRTYCPASFTVLASTIFACKLPDRHAERQTDKHTQAHVHTCHMNKKLICSEMLNFRINFTYWLLVCFAIINTGLWTLPYPWEQKKKTIAILLPHACASQNGYINDIWECLFFSLKRKNLGIFFLRSIGNIY